jgi:hypothetical protein
LKPGLPAWNRGRRREAGVNKGSLGRCTEGIKNIKSAVAQPKKGARIGSGKVESIETIADNFDGRPSQDHGSVEWI